MAHTDPKQALCRVVAAARAGGRGLGPFAAVPTADGLAINTGGGGTFLLDADVAALEAGGYIAVSRDLRGNGRVTVLKRAVDECAGGRR